MKFTRNQDSGMECGMDVNLMIITHSGCSTTEEFSCRLGIPYICFRSMLVNTKIKTAKISMKEL